MPLSCECLLPSLYLMEEQFVLRKGKDKEAAEASWSRGCWPTPGHGSMASLLTALAGF